MPKILKTDLATETGRVASFQSSGAGIWADGNTPAKRWRA